MFKLFRRSRLLMLFEKGFCKGSQFHRKTPELESLINKVVGVQACKRHKKETSEQLFSCEICEIFKNNIFYRAPSMASPGCWVTDLKAKNLSINVLMRKMAHWVISMWIRFRPRNTRIFYKKIYAKLGLKSPKT